MSTRSLTLVAAGLVATLGLAACGSSSTPAAAPSSGSAAASSGSDALPVTIKHAFGETTIEKKPARVATLGWGNHEVPLALGIVPVGMSKATWGDDNKNGILPWVEDKLKELGGQTPVLFDDGDSIDFEAVANTKPDVILAAYSGLTKEQHDTLTKIAPVVAYPKVPWGTSLEDMIELDAKGLGMAAEGEKLADDVEKQIETIAAKHPTLKGKSALFSFIDTTDLSKVGFYTTVDPRAELLEDVGMTTPKLVKDAGAKGEFYTTVSAEKSDQFSDVDVIVTYGKDEAAVLKAVKADPLWSKMAPVKNGAIDILEDDTPLAAAGNPSPLNIAWGLDKYLSTIDAAVAKVK